ncbi:MAG: tetratricopeptide repeat protein [Candidatus Aminicenantales bacterium]
MKRSMLIGVLVLTLTASGLAQDYKGKGRVFGYVYDEQGAPLEGVTVRLFSLRAQGGFSVETDKNGKWVASWIRGGTWHVDFEKVGYLTKKISIQVSELRRNPEVEVTLKKAKGLTVTQELEKELKQGNDLYAQGKYEEAIQVFNRMLEKHPEVYVIHMNIGNCYFKQEKYDLAEESYKKVLDKDPDHTNALMAIGNCYTNRGEDEKALEWYRKIPFDEIEDTAVLYNIGSQFYNTSQFEEALKYYKRAVELQQDFLDGLYQLGLTYLALQKYEDSIKIFETYLKHDPDSERAAQVKSFIEFLKTKIKENNL